jgi:hypothetical protein
MVVVQTQVVVFARFFSSGDMMKIRNTAVFINGRRMLTAPVQPFTW